MSEPSAALVWCPFPDTKSAKVAAELLLEERRIACANIIPGIVSVFEWHGVCSTSDEVAVLFKTTADRLDGLVIRLGECHPYDTPAVVGWRCDAAHPETLEWLGGSLA